MSDGNQIPPKSQTGGTRQRKSEHLEAFSHTWPCGTAGNLLDEVELLPDSLPQAALWEVNLETEFCNHQLRAPILISAMTGGSKEAGHINLNLAKAAQKFGLGMGLGSLRACIEDPSLLNTYSVRDVAPDILLLANIGIGQLLHIPLDKIANAVQRVEADALAVHINVPQELIQPEGDHDFRKTLDLLSNLIQTFTLPIVVKSVGFGIDPKLAKKLVAMGVCAMDVAGVGGTSWPLIEGKRGDGAGARLGEVFQNWGIPTAANILILRDFGIPLIASGGISDGLAAAKALSLGASGVGVAGAALRALLSGGQDELDSFFSSLLKELQMAIYLTGGLTPNDLHKVTKIYGPRLAQWKRIR